MVQHLPPAASPPSPCISTARWTGLQSAVAAAGAADPAASASAASAESTLAA